MSFTCRMVVGYFDSVQFRQDQRPIPVKDILLHQRLSSDTVAQLQAVCDELFGIQLRLAEYLTEFGILLIDKLHITREMFKVACVAHELFDMAAVDDLHRTVVYPRPQPGQEEKNFRQAIMEVLPKDSVEAQCQAEARQAEFENEVIQCVLAAREQRRGGRVPPLSP
jgi:hypothetical protein